MIRGSVRKHGLAVAGICVMLLAGAACSDTKAGDSPSSHGAAQSNGTPGASTTPGSSPSQDPDAANIAIVPAKGASSVQPDEPVTVTASTGKLKDVVLKDDDGDKVDGSFNADKTQWTSVARLKPGSTYKVSGNAEGTDGASVPISSTFKTLKAAKNLKASVAPLNGETVGVAMPVLIYWNHPVKDRAAVEKRLSVTIDTLGVNAGNNTWGSSSREISFTIGKSVVAKVDVTKHMMYVVINGKLARTIPITAGKDGFTTRSGVKVIMEKFPVKRMDARTVGIKPGDPEYYDIHDVKWAQRVTSSGEFMHGAPWSTGSQGNANVSHGCVGMSLADGQWYFQQTLRGDPVTVVGTARKIEPGNGWTDWNITWAAYKAGSALS